MSAIDIVVITDRDDPRLDALLPMFEDLHRVMHTFGMMQVLAPNGAALWMEGMKGGLERFSRMVIAVAGTEVIGFTCGSIKLAPEYLGGARVGHWTHLFVNEAHRRGGVSRDMSDKLHEWFTEKEVESVETHVTRDHPSSLRFVESFGYRAEWISLRRSN